jgi:DNA-directed RNA polymerase subunit RPC12/RpoP
MALRDPKQTGKPDKLPMDVSWCGTPRRGVYIWEQSEQRADGIVCTQKTACPSCGGKIFMVGVASRTCVTCTASSTGAHVLSEDAEYAVAPTLP